MHSNGRRPDPYPVQPVGADLYYQYLLRLTKTGRGIEPTYFDGLLLRTMMAAPAKDFGELSRIYPDHSKAVQRFKKEGRS